MSLLEPLQAFRCKIYDCFTSRADANMNILDALSSYGQHCKSVVELSEAPCFERQYSSITDGIADGSCQWQSITSAIYQSISKANNSNRIALVVDCTPNRRASAKTLSDRHVTYFPNPAPGNKPICVGHEYSTLAMIPADAALREKHWLIPLSTERVKSNEKGNEIGMNQIEALAKSCIADTLVISIADSKYGSEYCRKKVSQSPDWVHLFRLNSRRNIYGQAEKKESPKKAGNINRYGQKMTLNDVQTHSQPDEEIEKVITTSRGKTRQLTIKIWRNQLMRGSRTFKGYEHPLTVCQITLADENGKPLYKKPMWLGLTGKRRNEIIAEEMFDYYSSRYDIEHFFRFGKDKLLMDAYQTPDTDHEEYWWKLASLAYVQLYFACHAVPLLPKKWERYLPHYRDNSDRQAIIASPSQTQRGFSIVLGDVGTPAKPVTPRGNPKGRALGETQEKRKKEPVIYKAEIHSESTKKYINSDSEKSSKSSDSKIINKLVKSVATQLKNAEFSTEEFHKLLLAAT